MTMTDGEHALEPDNALLSRLALIDEQPLRERAAAFRHIHDELRQQLEASDGDTGPSA